MLDHTNAQNGEAPLVHGRSQKTPAGALTDREVPLDNNRSMAALHAWLDGEGSMAAVAEGDAQRYVDFWTRLNSETERRRQVKTPVDLQERIMQALPEAAPPMIGPWWRRSVTMSPAVAIATAAGLLAIGAALSSSRSR
jgi:hypothetical protein